MLKMQVRGLEKAQADLATRVKRLKNARGAHLAAAQVLRAWVLKNFRSEGALHEDRSLHWPRLRQSTIKQRIEKGYWPGKILQQTGRLVGAFETYATDKYGLVANRVHYSKYHEGGVPSRKVPKRKIFPTRQQGMKIVRPVYEHWVKQAIK